MNSVDPQRLTHRRWILIAVTGAATVAVVAAAVWHFAKPASSEHTADCAVVEDVAGEWIAASDEVLDTVLAETAAPGDAQSVTDRQAAMAAMVQNAADSVTTPAIKQHLNEWATAAGRLATSRRDGAGGAEQLESTEEFLRVYAPINDAAGALGELCPNMPTAQG
ncbi:MAG: hypothetical protein SW019_14275 [Actinomycetota bacterium]|nr:hypothetical protein [Actinomycetota bacterium]